MDEYYRVIRSLPSWLARPLGMLPTELASQTHELRLRAGQGIYLTVSGVQRLLGAMPECPPALCGMKLDELQMEEIFHALCGGSVHTHQMELAQGYLTAPGGCRVGVAGRFADRDGQLVIQRITSLNFRIARDIHGFLPEKLCGLLKEHFTGLLFAGEPGSGKTTLLRQAAEELGRAGRSTAVIDERGELFPPEFGCPPPAVDVLAGVPKKDAVQMALRTLSPQVILLDELGGLEEAAALEQGFFGGVDFIASIHASSADEALCRPQVQYLCQRGMLRALVALQGRNPPGQIREVKLIR